MLNELYKLSETLSEFGIERYNWHEDYGELPLGKCYRIFLSEDGDVSEIEELSENLVKACRKYGNNQQAFPAFNIAALYKVIVDKKDKAANKELNGAFKGQPALSVERLKELCKNDNWTDKLKTKIDKCLHYEIPDMPNDRTIYKLMRVAEKLTAQALYEALKKCVWRTLESGGDTKTLLPFLLYKCTPDKAAKTGSVSVILELSEWRNFGNPVACEATTALINERLNEVAAKAEAEKLERAGTKRFDAFGAPFIERDKPCPMPFVRLGSGFEVNLRSMFRENRCQFRYDRADDCAYPIAQNNRRDTKSALEWICRAENDGITWRSLDGDTVLFAYPDKLPAVPAGLAALFSGGGDQAARFERIAEEFLKSFRGLPPDCKPQSVRIFALRRIPPALSKRAKVVFTRNTTADGIVQSALGWQEGCRNLPDIDRIEVTPPFPSRISAVVNTVWKRDGEQAGKIENMANYDGVELFLDTPRIEVSARYMHAAVTGAAGLVLHIGNVLAGGKCKKEHFEAAGELLPSLGLLLYKHGYKKENYMENTGFLLGQLLKISDGLHVLYCKIKREGDIPPQLVGNSFFVSASERPHVALAQLSKRMMPYITWAKYYSERSGKDNADENKAANGKAANGKAAKTEKGNNGGLARWFMKKYEDSATKLKAVFTEAVKLNDFEKAQMFIGYLAKLPKGMNDGGNLDEDNSQEEITQ
jgi:hypothetical protein